MILDNFLNLPGIPFSYWIDDAIFKAFKYGKPIEGIGSVRTGISTGDNDKYLRLWHEVDFSRININKKDMSKIDLSLMPWIPYNKGGDARKWFGNNNWIVYWKDNKNFHRPRPNFKDIYLKHGLTWSFVTTGMFSSRYYEDGFLWDVAGSPCVFRK